MASVVDVAFYCVVCFGLMFGVICFFFRIGEQEVVWAS